MIDLQDVLKKYPECLKDKTTLKAYLTDLYPGNENKAYINLFLSVYELGIVDETKNSQPDELFVSRMTQKAVDTYFTSKDKAEWAVKEWCKALCIVIDVEREVKEKVECKSKEETEIKTQAHPKAEKQPASSNSNNTLRDFSFKKCKVGDIVKFGTYPQNADGKDNTPIEWQVLDVKGGKALIISKYALDCRPIFDSFEFDIVTWPQSTLCEWLNANHDGLDWPFMFRAFSEYEKSIIQDTYVPAEKNPCYDIDPGDDAIGKLFLLSINEAEKYFGSEAVRMCTPTEYAMTKGAITYMVENKRTCCWWLRTFGHENDSFAYVKKDGSVNNRGTKTWSDDIAVRPAMWLSIGPQMHIDMDNNLCDIHFEDFEIENGVLKEYKGLGGNVVVPNCVKDIGNQAFRNCSELISVSIPKTVKRIGNYAFNGCSRLSSIVIPDSVTDIGGNVFSDCTDLRNVTLSNNITQIPYYAFYNCKKLSNVIIPNSVTYIGESAFSQCESLTSITIPNGVDRIEKYAFSQCSSLTDIYIQSGVTELANGSFNHCLKLSRISVSKDNPKYYSDGNCLIEKSSEKLILGCKNSIIPSEVKTIGQWAFLECVGLTNITIPDNVTEIENYAFTHCTELTTIIIPKSVTHIGRSSFLGCSNLTRVVIPNNVISIGTWAFGGSNNALTIECTKGSYAEQYAKDNRIKYAI